MDNFRDNTYLFGSNANFIEELYGKYLENPSSVDASWHSAFSKMNDGNKFYITSTHSENSLNNSSICRKQQNTQNICNDNNHNHDKNALGDIVTTITATIGNTKYVEIALQLIDAYRRFGHTAVHLDPLQLTKRSHLSELSLSNYNLSNDELNLSIQLNNNLSNDVSNIFYGMSKSHQITLRQLSDKLINMYSSHVGFEIEHIEDKEERDWFHNKIELPNNELSEISELSEIYGISNQDRITSLYTMLEVEMFENFLHTKFLGAKRFSIEGGESAIASIEYIIKSCAKFGAEEFVIGMAHRGRLSTLAKIIKKTYRAMFYEFAGNMSLPEDDRIAGDVKYHMGESCTIEIDGRKINLSMTPNPSHLETVNVVLLGRVKAKQDLKQNINFYNNFDKKTNKAKNTTEDVNTMKDPTTAVVPIIIHGDASIAGQGTIAESLMMSKLEAYNVGGSIHMVINNQIGFTTNFDKARFGRYCTDIAKAINAPILHVNGSNVDAVLYATKLATEYRNKFKKDVFLDIVCYRKYGHNEGDEPLFTQPIMYKKINSQATKLSPPTVYSQQLIKENIITPNDYQNKKNEIKVILEKEFAEYTNYKPNFKSNVPGNWDKYAHLINDDDMQNQPKTGIEIDLLKALGEHLFGIPDSFKINSKIEKQFEAKKEIIKNGEGLDWGTAELLAFATLLYEGYPIRMTGQDVERGTFSHRHATLIDQESEKKYIPLNTIDNNKNIIEKKLYEKNNTKNNSVSNNADNIADNIAKLSIHNSLLSEFGVLGFEYGYSTSSPNSLVIWEAQYGDFANGAQVIIDQYIMSGESKWMRMNGMILLLPHGFQGDGPEHSSARLERFLQLCAQNNAQVCNFSTPASMFHAIRRQLHRNFRKPLIVMSPKSLLRHKLAVSKLSDMADGTSFKPVIVDNVGDNAAMKKIKKVIFCSGKVYYDLYEKKISMENNAALLVRLEQLYPFPKNEVKDIIKQYKNSEIIWCQEEHYNAGAYLFIREYFENIMIEVKHSLSGKKLRYIGKAESASTSAGSSKLHAAEQDKFLNEAIN